MYIYIRHTLLIYIYIYAYNYSAQLEKELKFLFGDNLRAAGGDGTLSLTVYLDTVAAKTGQRAILF